MQIDEVDFSMFIKGECSKPTLQIYDGVKWNVGTYRKWNRPAKELLNEMTQYYTLLLHIEILTNFGINLSVIILVNLL